MQKSWKTTIFLTLLALVFTIGLTFTAVELPKLADSFLDRSVNFPDLATGQNADTEYYTQLYLKYYHLRKIGYISLGLILLLIITGFITNKKGVSTAGAILLFLPVFGHFAATMFYLGGLALLRLIWLPFLDLSFDIMRLGEIVLLPYRGILSLFSGLGINLHKPLPYIITGLGFFIFMLGSLAWFQAKIWKKKVADFWVYRISRHPQYLGWIIWSYGIMFLPGNNMKRSFEISNTLSWLLTTMIIISIALLEELKMKRKEGEVYQEYYKKTPFLVPLPGFVNKFFSFPFQIFFKKNKPEKKREILTVIGFYTILFIFLSALYGGMLSKTIRDNPLSQNQINKIVKKIKETNSRIVIRKGLKKLGNTGESAVKPLLELLEVNNNITRWYTTETLGSIQSKKVLKPLIMLLYDKERWVRMASAGSLGRLGYKESVLPLIKAFEDPKRGISIAAARALSVIGDKRAIPPFIKALFNAPKPTAGAAAIGLGKIGSIKEVEPLVQCLKKREDCPYNEVGNALLKLGSEEMAINAFIAGLADERWYIRALNVKDLGTIRSKKARISIIKTLKDPNERVRRRAVLALKGTRSEDVLRALKEALKDSDFEVRLYARDALKAFSKLK